MTINVALVTNEHLILGCDSVASITASYLDPRPFLETDEDGNYKRDENGQFVAKFQGTDLQEVVTDAWGGATKMFQLCRRAGLPIAAVTSGLAHLGGRPLSAHAYDFVRDHPDGEGETVLDTVEAFATYMSDRFERHWAAANVPPALRRDIEFLVGGIGPHDAFPSLYRINLLKPDDQRIQPQYVDGHTGLAWGGQSDGVQRLMYGYDVPLWRAIEGAAQRQLEALHNEMTEAMVRILGDALKALGAELPDGVNTELPAVPKFSGPWNDFVLGIDYANLPSQSAVELVSWLVNLQSGKAHFVRGVPTVGGRTHVGLVARDGFTMLNEPELSHRNTGYDRNL